ncbi:tyrosine-type recombinase/integrase [Bosea sp. RAF48]|uniref:tyrosine-type recombinase/integrase n=1 Tax=Bosea sp. RAF48 TaxID=3237480 RepID=UPI003F90C035
MVEGVSIAPGCVQELLHQALDPDCCERVTTTERLAGLNNIAGIQFLYDDNGAYLEEVNGWQIEQGLKTPSPHTRMTRSSALKAIIRWFDGRNLRWQDCTELAHMNLMHRAFRGTDRPTITKGTWNQWVDHWYPFLRYAERKGYIDGIGFEPSDLKERGISAPPVRALSPSEFRLFLGEATSQRMQAGCSVCAGTGVRVAELASLKVSQVPNPDHPRHRGRNYLEGVIVGKGNKQRTIYWPIQAVKRVTHYVVQERAIAVDSLIDRVRRGLVRLESTYLKEEVDARTGEQTLIERTDAPLWLAENGDPLSYHRWGKDFAKASSKLAARGIHCSPHCLRHTYAIVTLSMLIKSQVKQEIIERELGSRGHRTYFFDPLREVK